MYFDQASHYQAPQAAVLEDCRMLLLQWVCSCLVHSDSEDPLVIAIQQRMQVLARIPPGHAEPLQAGTVIRLMFFCKQQLCCMLFVCVFTR